MDQNVSKVNKPSKKMPGLSGLNRMELARAWVEGNKSTPEPYLSAALIRLLLIKENGRGKAAEMLTAMAETGALPAYRDTSRKTKQGANPIVFRWSEVRALLLSGVRGGAPGAIVRIVPVKHNKARS